MTQELEDELREVKEQIKEQYKIINVLLTRRHRLEQVLKEYETK